MTHEHDETDYDGMGNYGRFPPPVPEQTPRSRHMISDWIMLIGCLCVPVIYMLTR